MKCRFYKVCIEWDKGAQTVRVFSEGSPNEQTMSLFEFLSSLGITARQACKAYDDEDK